MMTLTPTPCRVASGTFPSQPFRLLFLIFIVSLFITFTTALKLTEEDQGTNPFVGIILDDFDTILEGTHIQISIQFFQPETLPDSEISSIINHYLIEDATSNISTQYGFSYLNSLVQLDEIIAPLSQLKQITIRYFYPFSGVPFKIIITYTDFQNQPINKTLYGLTNTPGNKSYQRYPIVVNRLRDPITTSIDNTKFQVLMYNIAPLTTSSTIGQLSFLFSLTGLGSKLKSISSTRSVNASQTSTLISVTELSTGSEDSIRFFLLNPLPTDVLYLAFEFSFESSSITQNDPIIINFTPILTESLNIAAILYQSPMITYRSIKTSDNNESYLHSIEFLTTLNRPQIKHLIKLTTPSGIKDDSDPNDRYMLNLGVPPSWSMDFAWSACYLSGEASTVQINNSRPSNGWSIPLSANPGDTLELECIAEYSLQLDDIIHQQTGGNYIRTISPYISYESLLNPNTYPIALSTTSTISTYSFPSLPDPTWTFQPVTYGAAFDQEKALYYLEFQISVTSPNLDPTIGWSVLTDSSNIDDLLNGVGTGSYLDSGPQPLSWNVEWQFMKFSNKYLAPKFSSPSPTTLENVFLFNPTHIFTYRQYYSTYPVDPLSNGDYVNGQNDFQFKTLDSTELNFGSQNDLTFKGISLFSPSSSLDPIFQSTFSIQPPHLPRVTISVFEPPALGDSTITFQFSMSHIPLNFPSADQLAVLPLSSIWRQYPSVKLYKGTQFNLKLEFMGTTLESDSVLSKTGTFFGIFNLNTITNDPGISQLEHNISQTLSMTESLSGTIEIQLKSPITSSFQFRISPSIGMQTFPNSMVELKPYEIILPIGPCSVGFFGELCDKKPGVWELNQLSVGSILHPSLLDPDQNFILYRLTHTIPISPDFKRKISYNTNIRPSPWFDIIDTCYVNGLKTDSSFTTEPLLSDRGLLITFEQTPPLVVNDEVVITCNYYRAVSGSTDGLSLDSTLRTTITVPTISSYTSQDPRQFTATGPNTFPKFIPTPRMYQKQTGNTNTGLQFSGSFSDLTPQVTIQLKLATTFQTDSFIPMTTDLTPDSEPLFDPSGVDQNGTGLPSSGWSLIIDPVNCGGSGNISKNYDSNSPIEYEYDVTIKSLTILRGGDTMRVCQLDFSWNIPNSSDTEWGSKISQLNVPVWSTDGSSDLITINNDLLPIQAHRYSNPKPVVAPGRDVITLGTSLQTRICFKEPLIPTTGGNTLQYSMIIHKTTPSLPDSEVDSISLGSAPSIKDGLLINYCLDAFDFKLHQNKWSLGDSVYISLVALDNSSQNVVPQLFSPTFRVVSDSQFIYNPSFTIYSTIKYQPSTGAELTVLNPTNILQVSFTLSKTHTLPVGSQNPISKQFQLSLTLPSWISIPDTPDSHLCRSGTSNYQLTRIVSSSPPPSSTQSDSQIISFSSADFFSNENIQYDKVFLCTLNTKLDTTRTPINPSAVILAAPITISFLPANSSQRLFTTVPTAKTGNWLYPTNTACPTEDYFASCPFDNHPFIPPTTTTPPPPTPKLPTNTASLTNVCELVLTNKNQVEVFQELKHKQICSIPIAGSLTTRAVLDTDFPDLIATGSFPQGQTEFTLCDCKCKGYWHDDMLNDDNKKCSKCSVPDCPSLLTPNSDCTACECVTAQCKRFRTYVFSTIYVTPQALRYIAMSNGVSQQLSFDVSALSTTDLSTFVITPSTDITRIYLNTMSSFSSQLTSYIKSQISAQLDPKPTSSLESVTITPLIEGSFTVWKVTLSIVNGSQQPLSALAPLYGLPSIESTIGSLFGTFHTTGLGIAGAVSPPQLESAVTTPRLTSSKLKLFTTDVMRTGCLSSADAKILGTTLSATADQLHTCPLPNQYTSVPDDSAKAVLLNPLWSSCSTASSSTSFINYEDLLSPTEPTTTKLNIREIYPRCLDFAGVDVGLLHYIPCTIHKDKVLYSTTSSALLLPTYSTTLLSSFSTTTLSQPVQDRIQLLKSLQQPRFPQFPQSTIVPCPVITTSTSPKNEITYLPQRCPVGTYGDKCQLTNTIEETSMTASPTTLSAQSHSHIQWEYLGDNTQELTLVLQANKEKTGSGYFVWSQLLGTVPVASLYASAQIPTIDESKLFQYIYDAIASDNTAFTSIYNTQTDIIVRGYFTRAANLTIDLDTTQLPAGSFKFELPMLCNDFDVQCRQPISQFCHQSDGRCRCGPGYYDADPTKERTPDYVVELIDRIDDATGDTISEPVNFDGDDLQCLPICKNGGTWVAATQLCTCAPGFSGVNCEVKDECDHAIMCSHGNGYLSFTTTTADDGSSTDECSSDCTCYGQWVDSDVLIPTPTPPSTEPTTQCSICALKPLSSQLYTETTISQLQTLLDQYENNPSLAIYGTQDEKYTQTYQPAAPITTDTEANPLAQQRCYVTGTDPVTFDKGNCSKCLCRKGYGGDYCQLHVAYANITYTPGANNKYTYDTMTEVLLFDKIAEELSLSMNNFDKNDLFIVEHDTKQHLIRVGFYTGLDFFTRNAQLVEDATAIDNNEVTNPMGMMSSLTNQRNLMSVLQANKYNFDIWNQPPTNYNPQLPTNLDNLYTQWGDLTQTAPTKPITNQDTDSFLGGVNIETGIDDTSCVEQSLLGCFGAETKRASSTALIIGLVVGLVCAALLLLVLILVLRWCKKNKRGFWKSKEDQDRDEMSNFVPTTRKEFTGSTAAPSMTVGTLSIMPAGMNDGVEMTKTGGASATGPASSVQSVNNHTEVKDPTLPAEYKAYKDAKGNVFYINSETMTTSWKHPNEMAKNDAGGGDDYGSGW